MFIVIVCNRRATWLNYIFLSATMTLVFLIFQSYFFFFVFWINEVEQITCIECDGDLKMNFVKLNVDRYSQ